MFALIRKKESGYVKPKSEKKKIVLPFLQRIGKSLMFPIAILPFAAIFLRIADVIPGGDGASEFAKIVKSILSVIGNAVFGPVLPILFAIGISFGLSKDQRGEAAIVGFVVMMLIQTLLSVNEGGFTGAGVGLVDKIYGNVLVSPPGTEVKYGFQQLFTTILPGQEPIEKYQSIMVDNVLNGIMVGILVSTIYNHFNGIELPSVLGFFSGRRLIPVLGLISGIAFGIVWAIIFPWIAWCLYYLSYYMGQATGNKYANASIMGIFVFINRLLIPFGMHHIPNTLFWFTLGDFTNTNGVTVYGDINIFLKGDVWSPTSGWNNSGTFQSGFFPFMMFGLPALSFAFYKLAQDKDQAKKVASLLFGSSLVAFFTGITEPLEFSFMFISPLLYLIHATLAAFWAFIVGLMQIQIGFGFSAGFTDYVLSIPKSLDLIDGKLHGVFANGVELAKPIYNQAEAIVANPIMLLPIGVLCGASYYWVVKLLVQRFNIPTPGRGANIIKDNETSDLKEVKGYKPNKYTTDAILILNGVGIDNITNLEWCATRLRFTLKDNSKVNEELIKKSCSKGEIKVASTGYQIIIGTTVEMFGNEIQKLINQPQILNELSQNISHSITNETKTNKIETKEKAKSIINVQSIGNGKIYSLDDINDEAFKSRALGDGVVFDCLDGKVYSPINGTINVVFPTNHAYGISTDDGLNILIHIGVDTVSLDTNKIFKSFVKQGDKVKAGDLICEFDRDAIINANIEQRVIVLVTTDSEYKLNKISTKKNLKQNETMFDVK